jgi:hypothetical protein
MKMAAKTTVAIDQEERTIEPDLAQGPLPESFPHSTEVPLAAVGGPCSQKPNAAASR